MKTITPLAPSTPDLRSEEHLTEIPPLSADAHVSKLLTQAASLSKMYRATEKELLGRRIELGRIITQLKDEVGHGNFMQAFSQWVDEGKLDFSLKTAQRAMIYAELEAAGKFESVSNLSDAERVRKAETQAQKEDSELEPDPKADEGEDTPALISLPRSKIGTKASQLASPLFREFGSYDIGTKRLLLEELIELLTTEHARCKKG